ncbi:hypothetical protein BGM26_05005 [Bacillus sp. FJAT-29790]|uniref:hypothetical protein n=1 Tax=Bacillus sp. FJAT-29790 TaxID=1895002 RepID=UPI001C224AB0|nr:hypothetical protein [Bacillus sp. FJAT-29790]MBU8878346.1 hypothetical protein [Bacillus sp. FJAT-29790]
MPDSIAKEAILNYNYSIDLNFEVKKMLDFLMDISNIPAEYTIYGTFMIGLIIKFLWVWNIEYHFIDSLNDPHEVSKANIPKQQIKHYLASSILLNWITKCIRKKEGPGDDPEVISSLLLTY